MSSEVFENRELDFRSLYDDLETKINVQIPRLSGESRKQTVRETERSIEEATLLIQEMEEELRKAPSPYRSRMVSRVRGYKHNLEALGANLHKGSTYTASRGDFGYAQEDELEDMASNQRARLLQGTEILSRTTDSVARSHQIAAETDMVGTEIIDELGTQRESLVRTRDRLTETDANLSTSRKILKSMSRRIMTNKMILAVIIFVELGILGGVVYWKFFSHKKHGKP